VFDGNLTLLSTAIRTAAFGQLGAGASLVGNINWQRYIAGNAGMRFISLPLLGQIFANLSSTAQFAGSGTLSLFAYNPFANNSIYGRQEPAPLSNSFLPGQTDIISSGQSFFVQALAAAPAITLAEANKRENEPVPISLSNSSPKFLTVDIDDAEGQHDQAILALHIQGPKAYQPKFDASKWPSSSANGSFYNGRMLLSIKVERE